MVKRILSLILVIFIFMISASVPAFAFTPSDFEVGAKAAILYNIDTDTVIYSKDPDARMYPASLTKIMTAVLFLEKVADLDNEMVTVSENAVSAVLGTGAVVADFKAGETVKAREMLSYLLVKSCADAAYAISEYVAGDFESFVGLMNAKANELGMTGTNFCNPHGLHDSQHYTTANDMLTLTKYALNIPGFAETCSQSRANISQTNFHTELTLATTNYLIDRTTSYYYKYATGLKTGFTDEAGRCLVSTAKKDGMSYIAVLLNCPQTDEKGNAVRMEFKIAKTLFEWAFNGFSYQRVLSAGDIVGALPIELSWDTDSINVTPENDVYALVPRQSDNSTVKREIRPIKESFDATIKKGEALGTIEVFYAGEKIGEAPAVAADTVKGSGTLAILRAIKNLFKKFKVFFIVLFIIVVVAIIVFIILCIRLNRNRRRYGRVKNYRRF